MTASDFPRMRTQSIFTPKLSTLKRRALQADPLGVYIIPADERDEMEKHARYLTNDCATRSPRLQDRRGLSRGFAYYGRVHPEPYKQALHLGRAYEESNLPVALISTCEHLLNILTATYYALFERTVIAPNDNESQLQRVADCARHLARSVILLMHYETPQIDWDVLMAAVPDVKDVEGFDLRRYRELDSIETILDEVDFVHSIILPESGIRQIACLLYGGVLLGIYLEALMELCGTKRHYPPIIYMRLGTHTLSTAKPFTDSGEPTLSRLLANSNARLFPKVVEGADVLVLDDNVGHGGTFRTAARIISHYDGRAVTRAAETAWHLFERSTHDLRDAVTYPSGRPHFHFRYQEDAISLLLAGEEERYWKLGQRQSRNLVSQMRYFCRETTRAGHWSDEQQIRLKSELDYAGRNWVSRGSQVYGKFRIK